MNSPDEHDDAEEGMPAAEGQWWETVLALDADSAEPPREPEPEEPFPETMVYEDRYVEGATRSGSASDVTFTLERLNQISAGLRNLPPLDPSQRVLDRLGAVRLLREPILSAQRRGYTLSQIAATLTAAGFEIKESTLRVYLGRVRRRRRNRVDHVRRADMPLVLRGRIRG